MVTKTSPTGLIATTGAQATPPLNDLVSRCGWPLVLNAKPRRLAAELSLHNPACLLFWLEDEQRITETASLVAWTRERGHRPYRVMIAYRMRADVEPLFRAAGAHGFLPITEQSAGIVTNAVWSFVANSIAAADRTSRAVPSMANSRPANAMDAVMGLVRPP